MGKEWLTWHCILSQISILVINLYVIFNNILFNFLVCESDPPSLCHFLCHFPTRNSASLSSETDALL